MISFDTRLQQLLECGDSLTVNQRERFLRPLRQIDIACQAADPDEQSADIIKAATRVMAHQVLEAMSFHFESALSCCQNESQRVMLTALVAHACLNHHSIQFHHKNETLRGLNYPTMKIWHLEINLSQDFSNQPDTEQPDREQYDFIIAQEEPCKKKVKILITNEASNNGTNSLICTLTTKQLHENPFACAKKVFRCFE